MSPPHEEARPRAGTGLDLDTDQTTTTTPDLNLSLVLDTLADNERRGWHSIIVQGVMDPSRYGGDGPRCTCGKPDCKPVGKHPVGKTWQIPQSHDEVLADAKRRGRWAVPNIGVLTGTASGLLVLDVDPDVGGDATLAALVAEHGDLPSTYTVRTGSGGTHYYFRHPEGEALGNSAGRLGTGLDTRGEGGMVVAPPSVSAKGPYSLDDDADVAGLPAWLLDRLRPQQRSAKPVNQPQASEDDGEVSEAWMDKAVADELGRLDALREAATADGTGYDGEPWDQTTYEVACNLIELSNGNPSRYPMERAYADLFDHAPTDSGFDSETVAAKWESAANTVGDKGRSAKVHPKRRKRVEPPVEGAPKVLTDSAMAQHVADRVMAGRFCWAGALGWLRWDGRRWVECSDAAVTEAVRVHVIDLAAIEAKAGADHERRKALLGLQMRTRIGNMVSLARGIVLADAQRFDSHPDLLNVGNGVVDLRTGALQPHDPDLLMTRVTEVDYDAEPRTDDLDRALEILLPEVMDYLHVRLGQASTGHTPPDDVLPVLVGGGSNGKTMLMGAVQHAMGEHAVLVSDRVLLANPGDHPTEMMNLRGARMALIEETPEARSLDVARLKKVVGTPKITARAIRKDNVTWDASHSLLITSNYRPVVAESDHGTWRRLALVRFPYSYRKPHEPLLAPTDRRGDAGLRQRMKTSEANQRAVLRWIIDGARRWYDAEQVMPEPPAAVEADTLAWRKEADLVLAYIDERLIFARGWVIPGVDMTSDFTAWLDERGQRPWAARTFVQRMEGHDTVTGAGVAYDRARRGQVEISRCPSEYLPLSSRVLGERFRAWLGVRFRTDEDADQGAGTPGTLRSGEPPYEATMSGHPDMTSQASHSAGPVF